MSDLLRKKNILYLFFSLCTLSTILLYGMPYKDMTNTQDDSETVISNTVITSIAKEESNFVSGSVKTVVVSTPVTPLVQTFSGTSQGSQLLNWDEEDLSFFEHSVFVGDSISVGFETYCQNHEDSILTDTTYFLARVSCSAKALISDNALTTYASVIPLYQDEPQYVENSIAQIGDIEKIFLCFGVNDLVASTPEEYINNIQTLVDRILEKNPQVTVYMISIPCVDASVTTGYLNNTVIGQANALLQEACVQNGWGFINLVEYIMNENGDICPEYSSDGFVHENNSAYDIWIKVLKNYAHEGNHA